MKNLLKVFAISLLTPLIFSSSSLAADTGSSITISPFLREVRFSSDEATKELSISITNNTDLAQNFDLSVLDFGSLDESGGIVFAGSDANALLKKHGLANWLLLSSSNLSLGPKESQEIKATIVNDSSMTPGGHYAAIIASINNGAEVVANEIAINHQLSSLILATKVGGEAYDLRLGEISTNSNWFKLPSQVTLSFNNPGNVHVVPRGTVKLLSSNGTVLARGIINQESSFVFPETTRELTVELNKENNTGLWPTTYMIQVDYRYDGIDQVARKEKGVFYINTIILVLVLTVVIAVVVATRRTLKNLLSPKKHK